MYRFFKTQYASLSNIYFSSKRSSVERLQICSFCKVHHSNTSIGTWFIKKHCYGTMINDTEVYYDIKKKARIKRKYAELLEVTDQVTYNKKAAVKKLNASHLSLLVNLPDLTLDKLHKINNRNIHEKRNKKSIKTNNTVCITNDASNIKGHINAADDSAMFQNFEEYANDTNCNYEDINQTKCAHISLSENSAFPSILDAENEENNQDKNKSIFVTKREEIKKNKLLKNIKHKREKNQSETALKKKKEGSTGRAFSEYTENIMLAQVDVYIACKMYTKAQNMVTFLMKHAHATSRTVCTDICNMLLDAYCLEKDINKVLELYSLMIKNFMISPQTYAIVFEFIGEMKDKIRQQDLFDKVESDMVNNGTSFHDIFNKAKFKLNQSENVLKTIQLFRPRYQPEYVIPQLSHECKLLNNLSKMNSRKSPVEDVMTFEQLSNSLKRQTDLEKQCSVHIESIEKFDTVNNNTILYSKERVAALESSWEEVVLQAFNRNVMYLEQKEHTSRPPTLILHPFLKILPPEQYVQAVIQEVRNLIRGSEFFTPPLTILYGNLGFLIYRKYEMLTKQNNGVLDKVIDIYTKYLNWYVNTSPLDGQMVTNSRTAWQKLIYENQHYGASLDKECVQWPYFVCVNIGKFLYNIIINEIKINIDNQATESLKCSAQMRETPAFYTLFRTKGKIMVEQIKPHPILCKLYRDAQSTLLTFDATFIPSFCPPRPWISINTGGYTITKVEFVRTSHCARNKQMQILESVPSSQIYPALDNLNQLGSVPWKVNTSVLDILIKVFQDGGSTKLNVPQPPSILTEDFQPVDKNIFSKERMALKQKMNEMYSLWCDCLYKLSLANHFRNHIFWLPHNLDFRGRVYPIPPHLTHLGSDLARSILIFAQGKPLGPQGLDWLKIHTINLTGLKKRECLNSRLKFANENIDKIVDSAEHPLTGEMWWAESDEPWQTLASCMEVTKALKSPNPEKYISSFPVHQDGSCNGLQHYAALGRDQIGAESVNLHPADIPQDVYNVVATMVETIRAKDAARDLKIAQELEGHIKRKVIKQTVMTTVYGVTKYGAKLQIMKQLKDLETFPQDRIWEASNYLACKTFDSLQSMFTSARTIQEWLSNCAYIISAILGERVEWVTPLGFPVLQPYSRFHKHTVKNEEHFMEKVDSLKQRNAFPPNFIHSLDSSHMMLTSLFCEQAGITFMSVHDCFWTHPCTIDIMNKICREQFVTLHSEPILEDLSEYLHTKYLKQGNPLVETFSNSEKENAVGHFCDLPTKGSFDLQNVLKSTYFFS